MGSFNFQKKTNVVVAPLFCLKTFSKKNNIHQAISQVYDLCPITASPGCYLGIQLSLQQKYVRQYTTVLHDKYHH